MVPAGVFTSKNAYPGLSVRLPASGWRVVDDWDSALTLRPRQPAGAQLHVVTGWYPVSPKDEPLTTTNSPAATVSGLRRNTGIVVSRATTARLGSGLRATVVDLTPAPGASGAGVDYLSIKTGSIGVLSVPVNGRTRLFLARIHEPYGPDTIAVAVDSRGRESRAWSRTVMSVLRTLRLPDGITAAR